MRTGLVGQGGWTCGDWGAWDGGDGDCAAATTATLQAATANASFANEARALRFIISSPGPDTRHDTQCADPSDSSFLYTERRSLL
ncbi:hypothetical protein GCM10007242_45700 [Pigmentiphaga litoralis]|nr:hypothetical protein GCM10007242_45700 [Pigmentiphaga litoralis]